MMKTALRVGLAGLGTVGAGVVEILRANHDLLTRRAGRPIEVSAVSARDRSRDRGLDLSSLGWEDDARQLATRDDVDVVVELVGGSEGVALDLAQATLAQGKPLVTANKAMLALHGFTLASLAENTGATLHYEAAIAGGIPIVKAMREGFAANRCERIYGILNGTCNFILTEMENGRREFADVLAQAQKLGYAEADPTFDIDGMDSAHKLALLASLAFGVRPDCAHVITSGVRAITLVDIERAAALGFRIKLVGMARLEQGKLLQYVHPCLTPLSHPLAHVDGSLNAVVAEGDFVGRLFLEGHGAGRGPTASAVVADLVDVARGRHDPALGMPTAELALAEPAPQGGHSGRFYLRLTVEDRPGVLAEISAVLRDANVSIESLIQQDMTAANHASLVMVTHECQKAAIMTALVQMETCAAILDPPVMMHILDL